MVEGIVEEERASIDRVEWKRRKEGSVLIYVLG
jgi:hypothetical protein